MSRTALTAFPVRGMSLNVPQLQIEVAFGTAPNSPGAASPVWTDITGRVKNVTWTRSSRVNELDAYQAGTASMTLINFDGLFNVQNPSSPYYGQLKIYVPLRIVAVWQGVVYPQWQGYVERWPQTWDTPQRGLAPIQCVDAFTMLGSILLDPVLASEVLADGPSVYYPCTESQGSTAGNASAVPFPPAQVIHTKQANPASPGSYQFGGALNVVGAASQSGLSFSATNNNAGAGVEDGYALTLPKVPILWAGWSVELWCQIPTAAAQYPGTAPTPATQYAVLFRAVDAYRFAPTAGPYNTDPPGEINLIVNQKTVELRICTPDSKYGAWTLNRNLADNILHHVVITYQPGTVKLYIDGAYVLYGTVPSSNSENRTSFVQVGAAVVNAQTQPGGPAFDGRPLTGTVGHIAIYPSTLSQDRVNAHRAAGGWGFSGEPSGVRAQRLLAYGGWQPAMQTVAAGRSSMGPAQVAGATLLQALQDVADAELGTLTVTADGKVDIRGRDDRLLQLDASIVFGAGGIPYQLDTSFVIDYDPSYIYNDVQISRPNGITAESVSNTSIVEYFPRQLQKTLNVGSDDEAQFAADFELSRYREPKVRLEALTVQAVTINPVENPAVWPSLLGMDLHRRVTVAHSPMGSGDVGFDGFVEQITYTVDADGQSFKWDPTVQVSPVLADYWVLEDPVQGVVDGTNVVAF